ncbi:MAG: pyridoxal-phosphate dependent enzyme [Sphingobacteriaceae bacterium]|nr:pyridoxal-phosphate dependent enzyme [Sphingobacteriaceae bacterium]
MQLPSPTQQLNHEFISQLWVKRDDLIDTFVSGNKWRKLKYSLEKARLENKNHLITFGGAFSNHLLATAAASAKNNFTCTAFVRGEKVENEMLMLCKLFGMSLIFVDREIYKHKKILFDTHFGKDENSFFINEGGASEEGVLGCCEIISELTDVYDHIFVAAGTGTTAAGLLKEINLKKLTTKLHVIPVLKGGDFITEEIEKYEPNTSQLTLHTDYHFGGYAKTTPKLIEFMKHFISSTGLMIDPIYTAKMFFAIDDLAKQNYFKKDEKILALHTGGIFGVLGMKDKF